MGPNNVSYSTYRVGMTLPGWVRDKGAAYNTGRLPRDDRSGRLVGAVVVDGGETKEPAEAARRLARVWLDSLVQLGVARPVASCSRCSAVAVGTSVDSSCSVR